MNKDKSFAFVLMPFSREFDDVYEIAIKEAAAKYDIRAERLDEQLFGEGMMDRIYRQIESSDFIIADVSTRNPNVYYELGYAHGKEKLCILLSKSADDIPFDLKHRRHIVYGDSVAYLRAELAKNIEWAKAETNNVKESQIRVSLKKPYGDLETTKHSADATLHFTVDLFNESSRPSAEISAVYLYTATNWDMSQGEKECGYTDADLAGFKYRFFLDPPVKRLEPGSWAQLKFKASRTLALAWEGDEIKDSYLIGGKIVLRLVTAKGNFDYHDSFSVEVVEVPF